MPGQLWTLAARTGGGKTAAAGQIAEHVAELGKGAAIFSLEMPAGSVLKRVACSRARVDGRKFRNGYSSRDERIRVSRAIAELAELPLFIDDTASSTVGGIYSAVRRQMIDKPVSLVVVDYLQLLRMPGRWGSRAEAVGATARELKLMALEFGVTVLMLSQFNRDNKTQDRQPVPGDLKESGDIENHSDVIVFIHSKYDPANRDEIIPVEWIFGKQRDGWTGCLDLVFHRPFVRFAEHSADLEAAA